MSDVEVMLRYMTDAEDDSSTRFACPRCGAFSHHVDRPLLLQAVTREFATDLPFGDGAGRYRVEHSEIRLRSGGAVGDDAWRVTLCSSCDLPTVWRGNVRMYPRSSSVPPAHPDMPPRSRELYEEARLVLQDSRRAAAALVRAALETLLKELDPSDRRKNLQTRIADLHGRINSSLWKALTALRVVGNDSLHGEEDELVAMYLTGDAAEIVEPFFVALNALVEELVTQPRKADEIYQLIPPEKREAAERTAASG